MTETPNPAPESLDPDDWDAFRASAHEALDAAIDHLAGVRDRPVWQPVPDDVVAALNRPLPRKGLGEEATCRAMIEQILPYPTGNTHPAFFGWVHGAGLPIGIAAEAVAAAMNANLGGRLHGAIHVERQVIAWCLELFDFPATASGLMVTGTSMATAIALAAARHRATDGADADDGLTALDSGLVGYTSSEAHNSVEKAFRLLGLGSAGLRKIGVDSDFRMNLVALKQAIADDRARGLTPFCAIGSAGTVNTGAVDDLTDLAALAADEQVWLHIDGAFGALAMMSASLRPRLAGIERADSLAFDFHKWAHVPYDAGFVLMRDGDRHRAAFTKQAAYLEAGDDGLAGGRPWFSDYGLDLSRGFRALKVWAALTTHGTDGLGAAIARNERQAARLAAIVDDHPDLELLAPQSLSIVCFRYRRDGLDDAGLDTCNREIVRTLQNSGIAAPSGTTLPAGFAIRVNITNHRTTDADLDRLVDEVLRLGAARA